jgi:hypothetical protein
MLGPVFAAATAAAPPALVDGEKRWVGETLSRGVVPRHAAATAAWEQSRVGKKKAASWAGVARDALPADVNVSTFRAALASHLGLPQARSRASQTPDAPQTHTAPLRISQGEEATAPLPVDAPPVHPGVEAFTIAADDDRVVLRGQARGQQRQRASRQR